MIDDGTVKSGMLPRELSSRGRAVYGATVPSGAVPCSRSTALCDEEVIEVADLIARGRRGRQAVRLPENLQTRDWRSVEKVIVELDRRLGRQGVGWKVGAASSDIRAAEGLPSPSPGRIYKGTVYETKAVLPSTAFINYRNIEAEFAFEIGRDFLPRDDEYREDEVRDGIVALFAALEIGDSVFLDWYGSSSYYGTCLDNGGGAALVVGQRFTDWAAIDIINGGMDLYFNDFYLKSGQGRSAMGDPVTSLTWMINWASRHGYTVRTGEIVSTGTCTGHCFALPGDTLRGDFGVLGTVEATFE